MFFYKIHFSPQFR